MIDPSATKDVTVPGSLVSATEPSPDEQSALDQAPCDHRCPPSHRIMKGTLMLIAMSLVALNGVLYAAPQVGETIANWLPEVLVSDSNSHFGYTRSCNCSHKED